MAVATDSAIESVRQYIRELRKNNIPVQYAILFGSYVSGNPKEESDIDIALVSEVFTGDWFEDRRRIVPFRRKIDNRIEPMPFRPEDFDEGGILIDEIKRTGKRIDE
jgi:uncharacterized protein